MVPECVARQSIIDRYLETLDILWSVFFRFVGGMAKLRACERNEEFSGRIMRRICNSQKYDVYTCIVSTGIREPGSGSY